jgi:hypothetical protein
MKHHFSLEQVNYLVKQIKIINDARLEDILWWDEDGEAIEINPKVIEEFKLTGLNNIDFITTGYYKT